MLNSHFDMPSINDFDDRPYTQEDADHDYQLYLETLRHDELVADDEAPVGECPFCGDQCCDDGEMAWHAEANCIGGTERFRN